MFYRFLFAVPVVLTLAFSAEAQQVVRFQTTVGDFDLVLNPTNNPVLDEYAQNMVNYVQNNSYLGSWINRASKNTDGTPFVLQMGGFFSHTKRAPQTINSTGIVVPTFAPVAGHPATQLGLSNTVGTVALALPGNGSGGTDQNAGTSSFFVNLTNNSFLDTDFTVFAAVPDMTTINKIMALNSVDETQAPNFGTDSNNLGFTEVPVGADGFQVFIKKAFLLTDTLATAQDISRVQSVVGQSSSLTSNPASASDFSTLAASGQGGGSTPLGLSSNSVPEPTTVALILIGALGFGFGCGSRRRIR